MAEKSDLVTIEIETEIDLEVDAGLLEEARRLGVDISAAVEAGLRDAIRLARIMEDLE